MPKNTKVHRCVEKLKKQGKGKEAYAICQKSTGQSYATGKKLREQLDRVFNLGDEDGSHLEK